MLQTIVQVLEIDMVWLHHLTEEVSATQICMRKTICALYLREATGTTLAEIQKRDVRRVVPTCFTVLRAVGVLLLASFLTCKQQELS